MIYDLAVIGGGASGMVASIVGARRGLKVAVCEKNDRVGKKLLATGNGKCNLAGTLPLIKQYNTTNVISAFDIVSLDDIKAFFEGLGLMLREREGRIYPYSEQASTVLNALREEMDRLKVDIYTQKEITKIKGKSPFTLVGNPDLKAQNVLLASGSNAGFGWDSRGLYEEWGHKSVPLKPSLVPLLTDTSYIRGLKGVRVQVCATLVLDGQKVRKTTDEVLFKDNGLSGSAIFTLSTPLARAKHFKDVRVVLDFIPEMGEDELFSYLTERIKIGFGLDGLFHKEIVFNLEKRVRESLSTKNALEYARLIKSYDIQVKSLSSHSLAQVMSGGLVLDDFNLTTMESRIQKGLFASGEVLNVDGECGGYNLMWAFCSGIIAGNNIKK